MSKESIEGPLTALRNAGTVCGVCLARSTEVVVNLFPFSAKRVEEMITVIDDILLHFQKSERAVDQLCFGYDGGNLVIVTDEDYRLIVMHMHPDEIDFIAKAARAFLVDFQVGLFAEQLAGRDVRLPELTNGVRIEPIRDEPKGEEPDDADAEVVPASPVDETAKVPAVAAAVAASSPIQLPAPKPLSPRPILPPKTVPAPVPAAVSATENDEASDEEDVQGPRLAPNQPKSTLPPPRVPKSRES